MEKQCKKECELPYTEKVKPRPSVVDPNTLNLYPGPWPNLDPDPGYIVNR